MDPSMGVPIKYPLVERGAKLGALLSRSSRGSELLNARLHARSTSSLALN